MQMSLSTLCCSAALLASLAGSATAQIGIPPHNRNYTGFSRGFSFVANTDFFINKLDLPLDAFVAGDTASYLITLNGVEVLRNVGGAGAHTLAAPLSIKTGDLVLIVGNWSGAATSNFSANNSYGSSAPYATMIEGVAHQLDRGGWQHDVGDPGYAAGGPGFTGLTGDIGRVLVHTTPPSGLFAGFSAAPTAGAAPLPVQFTDSSFTSAPGGITVWGWDFDNNGVIDSPLQSPAFTYMGGLWDVSLTVDDGVHTQSKETKLGYIQVDVVVAEFSATPLVGNSPLLCTFTDLSTGPILTWDWDFDNDGIVDSNAQNPTFTYATPGKWTVVLGVANATSSSTETKADYIETDKIVASFTTSNNAPAPGGTVNFTDTSTGPVTSWSWDLDGDGVADVFTQNASFTYAAVGIFNVKLTISNGFATDDATDVIEVGTIAVGPFARTFSGGLTRGFWFQTPVAFSIVGAQVYNETGHALQNVEIYRMAAAPPVFNATGTGGQIFYQAGAPANQVIPMFASFAPGDFVGVLGCAGDAATAHNSYGNPNVASSVLGQAVTLTRMGTQFNIASSNNNPYWQEPAGPIARTRLLISNAAAIDYGDASDNGLGLGAPTMTTSSAPLLGTTSTIDVTDLDPGSISIAMVVGFGRTPLVTPLGTINISNIVMDVTVAGVGAGTFPFPVAIPNTPSILGGPTNFQAVILNPSAPNFFGMTNGTEWYLGDF